LVESNGIRTHGPPSLYASYSFYVTPETLKTLKARRLVTRWLHGGYMAWSTLPQPPDISDSVLKTDIAEVRRTIDQYNSELKMRKKLESMAKRSEIEVVVLVFRPLFLMIALALSITKVTAEIKFGT
jgi:hypothetical protein